MQPDLPVSPLPFISVSRNYLIKEGNNFRLPQNLLAPLQFSNGNNNFANNPPTFLQSKISNNLSSNILINNINIYNAKLDSIIILIQDSQNTEALTKTNELVALDSAIHRELEIFLPIAL